MPSNIATVVIVSVLIAFIGFAAIVIGRNLFTPKKIGSIDRLIKSGKAQQAQRVAKAVLSKNPNDYEAHYWLGEAYLADNKPELAFMEYKTVNRNAVFNGSIPELAFRRNMSKLYAKYNQSEEALKEYLLLTKLDPKSADNFYQAGKLYEQLNQLSPALGFYQKSLQLDKRNDKAHAAVGSIYMKMKQYPDAMKEITTAIKMSPETYSNYYYLGKIYKDTKEYPQAIKAFEQAIRDSEMRQRALIERGSCYMLVDQVDNAIADYDHAIKVAKNESSQETLFARYFLAACYEKTHKIDKAIEQWTLISKKNSSFRDVASKLNDYRDVQTNDSMKEYLTASPQQFLELAKKAAKTGFNLVCQKVEPTNFGCVMLAMEDKSDSWMNARKQIQLLEFFRNSQPVSEAVIRKAADTIKNKGYFKAILFSSSGFSEEGIKFAENRPITLAGKDMVENILARAGV